MSISEGTYIVYNLNAGGMSVEKYDAWKVLNILKDAGMSKVHYKPLTPAEIKHFSASLFGMDPAKVAKIKVVYFTGNKDVAVKALKESGVSKFPDLLWHGIADQEVKKYIERPKGKRERVQDSGDWDDNVDAFRYRDRGRAARQRKESLVRSKLLSLESQILARLDQDSVK